MSTRTVTKKRKSTDADDAVVKKPKVAKSTKSSTPLKSALKKPRSQDAVTASQAVAKSRKQEKAGAKSPKPQRSTRGNSAKTDEATIEDDADGAPDLTEDQTAALLAGFSDSDEDEKEDDGIAISRLPHVPTTKDIQKRIQKAIAEQDDPETTPGVVYIGRIPHGFYEAQMRAYLLQFGQITRLRLARNKKTGHSRHFGFVEFASAAVADIVVKTMDKYLLFNHLLQVRRVPKDQIKDKMFVGAKKHPVPRNRMEREFLKDGMVREDWEKRVERENLRRKDKAEKLKEMGYEFEPPLAKSVAAVAVKPPQVEDVTAPEEVVVAEIEAASVTEPVVETSPKAIQVTETVVTKKRSAEGKPKSKKVVKKSKVEV